MHYLLTTLTDTLPKNNSLLTNFIWSRGVEEESRTSSTLNLAHTWLKDCSEKHEVCQKIIKSNTQLPTRVIDVNGPHLKITKGLTGKYTALSYCWGQDSHTHLKLIKNKLDAFQGNIPWVELPQTLKDAIFVTRGLGIPFLWIDALCIIQDDREDWRTEAACMNDVYRNAVVTLFAADSASASQGFLSNRMVKPEVALSLSDPESRIESSEIFVTYASSEDSDSANHETRLLGGNPGPWSTRGWTLQEYLSATSGIFFTKHQMSWYCPTCVVKEDGEYVDLLKEQAEEIALTLKGTYRHMNLTEISTRWVVLTQMKQVYLKDISDQIYHKLLLDEFHEIVNDFLHRLFTFHSDKLAATAGVARIMEENLKLQGVCSIYYAGLWSSNWVSGLQWESNHNRNFLCHSMISKKESSNAPSWSWASIVNAVYSRNVIKQSFLTQIQSPIADDQERFNPTGHLVLKFNAPLVYLSDMWMKIHSQEDGNIAQENPGILAFEKILREILCLDASDSERYLGTEFAQKHEPYAGQQFAVIKVSLSQNWIRPGPDDYDSSQSSPTSIDTDSTSLSVAEASHIFYLILESVQHYQGAFRRVASFELQ
ncbi:hypothetical protein D9758_015602 [Tetrapyrgos nigripes]|uniref:Heterokaryon incompatibility domain-containing protein n=1 Tax=Tetrapyrgos nigripes TaxID=182062 RepID=A0A8H5CDC1_9AGAR|nr:hypothetical protein D9758_015602 [Tetrapyrgos nigripes]